MYVSEEGQIVPQDNEAGVCGILAPGNYDSPIDILHKLFVENKVVAWKPHVVNEKSTLPTVKSAFAELIKDNYLVVIDDSSPKAGAEMVQSPVLTELLLTGGAPTYDRIVWGSPDEQQHNKESGKKLFCKKFDAELGAVTPVIVLPGKWSEKEIQAYADSIAFTKLLNSGAICVSPQVVLLDKDWPQREEFLTCLKTSLDTLPRGKMYYPGSKERQEKTKSQAEKADVLGEQTAAPVVFLNDLKEDSAFFKEECFALSIGDVALSAGNDPKKFFDMAADFANNKLFGTLSATVICPPSSEAAIGGSDYMIEKLNYGIIGYNVFSAQAFFYQSLPWGAYPGHSDKDIQSNFVIRNPSALVLFHFLS